VSVSLSMYLEIIARALRGPIRVNPRLILPADLHRLPLPCNEFERLGLARGWSGGGGGPGCDFRCELLKFALQAAHLLKRPLRQNGEFLWLAREQFPAQRGQRLVHALQLLHRLSQNGFGFVHKRTRNSPFLKSGASRTRLKNSTYVLYNGLSRSAIITSKR